MKNLHKAFYGLVLISSSVLTTSCMEQFEPQSSIVTESQMQASASAAKAACLAMPANFNYASFFDDWVDKGHCYYGYGSIMHIRDIMTGDLAENTTKYSHYYNWAQNQYQGQDYIFAQYFWNYFYKFILSTNDCISAVNPDNATDEQKGYLGAGLAFRAMIYLDMARMYEFLANDKTSNINMDGNDISGLTVPIIKNGMSPEDAANNPRATHAEMSSFIESDLLAAKEYIVNLKNRENNTLPDLACVNGLLARLYMWDENYPKAKEAARAAIDAATITPITKEQYLDKTTGFNQVSQWLWGSSMTKDDWCVQTGIVNWVSWLSNQTSFGYTGPATGLYNLCDKNFYDRINNTDFRKLLFKAPKGHSLSGQEPFLMEEFATDDVPTYTALKFRPAQGNVDEPTIGAASAYPIMRLEEMYFIEAEAAEHIAPGEGMTLLTNFMQTYRDEKYAAPANAGVDEIVFQKRVELWGEGQTFFDIKRLNMSVKRGYQGTPFTELARFNTDGRPAWMNLVIVITEKNNNKALEGMNNPDPSDLYKPWTDK